LILSTASAGHVADGEALTCLCRCTECAAGYAAGRDVSLKLPAFVQHASLPVAVSDEEADATWRTALRVASNVEMRGQARAHAGGGLCCSSSGCGGAEFRWHGLTMPAALSLPSKPRAQVLFDDYARGAVAAGCGPGVSGAALVGQPLWVFWVDEPNPGSAGGEPGAPRLPTAACFPCCAAPS
jgi:hypothetical protein